jgi:hypothetical protein
MAGAGSRLGLLILRHPSWACRRRRVDGHEDDVDGHLPVQLFGQPLQVRDAPATLEAESRSGIARPTHPGWMMCETDQHVGFDADLMAPIPALLTGS